MKLSEAKEIVASILDWQFVLMGIKERKEINPIDIEKYSLQELITANKIVEGENNRKSKLAEYHRNKGHKVNGYSHSMLLADRLIAAVYTALNFSPDGQMKALVKDKGVGVVKANYK